MPPSFPTHASASTVPRRRLALAGASLVALLACAWPARQAAAASSFQVYTAACQSDCVYGDSAFWTPPDGGAANSSVSHGWSFIASGGGSDSSNFAVSASAGASISGTDHWAAHSSVGGYFNSSGAFGGNGALGIGYILIREEFTPQHTSTWNGPGWFRLSYRISGDVALSYAETSDVSGQKLGMAQSSITFECGSAALGGAGSSPCESADFAPANPGSINLIAHLDFDAAQHVDRIVSFDMPVFADRLYAYRMQTSVSSVLRMFATDRTGKLNGLTSADFSHTFTLVDAQLFDAAMTPVEGWSMAAGSGFDYAHIAAVPEPQALTLLLLGLGLVGWRGRSTRR